MNNSVPMMTLLVDGVSVAEVEDVEVQWESPPSEGGFIAGQFTTECMLCPTHGAFDGLRRYVAEREAISQLFNEVRDAMLRLYRGYETG